MGIGFLTTVLEFLYLGGQIMLSYFMTPSKYKNHFRISSIIIPEEFMLEIQSGCVYAYRNS